MLVIDRETFLVCLIKNKLSKSIKYGSELGDNALFTLKDIATFRTELREKYDIVCPHSTNDIIKLILQYTELFVIYNTSASSIYGLRWNEIFHDLDGYSLVEYLLKCFNINHLSYEIRKFLGLEKTPESFDISKVPSNAIEEIIDSYEKCKASCASMSDKEDSEIVKELLDFYNETIILKALNYTKENK